MVGKAALLQGKVRGTGHAQVAPHSMEPARAWVVGEMHALRSALAGPCRICPWGVWARRACGQLGIKQARCVIAMPHAQVADKCIVCPAHGTAFDLATGAVKVGSDC